MYLGGIEADKKYLKLYIFVFLHPPQLLQRQVAGEAIKSVALTSMKPHEF